MVASEKGVVVGRLTFTEDGDPIDCSRMGVGGKAIPPNVDKVCFPLTLPVLKYPISKSLKMYVCTGQTGSR